MSISTAVQSPPVEITRFSEDLTYLLAWGCAGLTTLDDRYAYLFAFAVFSLQEQALRQVGETALADEAALTATNAAYQYAARVQEMDG